MFIAIWSRVESGRSKVGKSWRSKRWKKDGPGVKWSTFRRLDRPLSPRPVIWIEFGTRSWMHCKFMVFESLICCIRFFTTRVIAFKVTRIYSALFCSCAQCNLKSVQWTIFRKMTHIIWVILYDSYNIVKNLRSLILSFADVPLNVSLHAFSNCSPDWMTCHICHIRIFVRFCMLPHDLKMTLSWPRMTFKKSYV